MPILDHAVDFVKKVVVELSSLEDAALAEKLDSLKDVQETGRIAKLQQSSCFVTDPKLRKKGTAASVAARASEVKERGAWIP